MGCDFGEVLAQVARGLERRAHQRQMGFGFDSRGPELLLDTDDIKFRCGLHRLGLGVQDLLRRGVMMMDGQVRRSRSGQGVVTLRLWAAGVLDDEPATEAVLRRLDLSDAVDSGHAHLDARPRLRRVEGTCPCTGARIRLARSPAQGVVAVAEGRFAVDSHGPTAATEEPQADHASAWVVGADTVTGDALVQRLKRLGWSPQRFDRPADALRRLRVHGARGGREVLPALLLLVDPTDHDGNRHADIAETARRLGELLPADARKVLAVVLGSPVLAGGPRSDGFEVVPLPVGPAVLRRVTLATVQPPLPLALPPSSRRALLVVDDEPINRSLAVQMLNQLGERTDEAGDGLEAISRCREGHPSLVLMDVDMPRLDGLSAARELRALQAAGEVAPCPILAATASLDPSRLGACIEAGMDEAMLKPLSCSTLRDSIQRWTC
jgi:CheY-like chemotaxis protein